LTIGVLNRIHELADRDTPLLSTLALGLRVGWVLPGKKFRKRLSCGSPFTSGIEEGIKTLGFLICE